MTTLEILSQSREARWRYEARQKFLRDQAYCRRGWSKGLTQGKVKVARNLLAMGMDVGTVVKRTGLPEEDVRAPVDRAKGPKNC